MSGFLDEVIMQRLEETVKTVIQPKLWILYIHDTFLIEKSDNIERFHQKINNVIEGK